MSIEPAYLTIVRGKSEAWPLQAKGLDGTDAIGVYDGTETLAASVFYGPDASLSATPTAAWTSAANGQYVLSVGAAQSATLAPGSYTVLVDVRSGSADAPLLEATLVVEPAPTDGTGSLRTLAQPGELVALASDLANNPGVPAALEAATRAIEAYCRRPLVLADYDHRERPGRTRRIYLRAWPVVGEPVFTYHLEVAGSVQNRDASTNQQASVTLAPAAYGDVPGSGQPATLTLRRTAGGVATVNTFSLSDYATIGALFAAIAGAGGGWTTTVGGVSNGQDASLLPPSRLLFQPGRAGALSRPVELRAFATEVGDYNLVADKGYVELFESRPEAFRYPDRAYGANRGFASDGQTLHADVRCQYRAGYAIAQADLSLGYEPVPSDLRMATLLVARAILSAPTPIGAVKQQNLSGSQFTFRGDASTVPLAARPLLQRYVSYRIGGWGA